MADEDTSIRIKIDTWKRLNERKTRPNQSFDDIIRELLDKDEERNDEGNPSPRTTAAN